MPMTTSGRTLGSSTTSGDVSTPAVRPPIGAVVDGWSAHHMGEFFEGGPVFLRFAQSHNTP